MPVKKTNTGTKTRSSSSSSAIQSAQPSGDFAKKILLTLVGILLAYLVIYFGTLIRNNIEQYQYIGKQDESEKIISVEAVGEAVAKPDIAMTTMGMVTEASTVSEAQDKNTQTVNALIDRLKQMGIEQADIETQNYQIMPLYDYSEEDGRVLRGYQVDQQVRVKIRDIEQANDVVALAGELGVSNVSGLTFTIDEKGVYVTQAREDAIKKLKEKINHVSDLIGVYPVEVVSYDEYEENAGVYPMREYDMKLGSGTTPDLEAGSETIRLRVRVGLEML